MQETLESLYGIGYQGKCLDNTVLDEALQNGVKSETFRSLVGWIANELSVLANLEEQINDNCEINEFLLELSGFLKEISCPYPHFVTGPISNRFQSYDDRQLLLHFLITELMAWKMCHKFNPPERVVIEIAESKPAAALKSMMQNLSLGKPPDNITPKNLFDKILPRVDEAIKKNCPVPRALFNPSKSLTKEQWSKLAKLQQELDAEYDLRRDMLITRLDVTVQSFHWSENIKGKEDKVAEQYSGKRNELDYLKHGSKTTDLVELLAAREDIAIIDKTSSANVRQNTQSDIQKHVIGRVPDRGGRAREHAPPPPEMPSWQQNRNQGGRGGGGGGGGGGNRGGRGNNAGGGFNQPPQQQRNFNQNNYQQPSSGQHNQSYNNRGNSRVQGGWSQSGSGSRDYSGGNNSSGGGAGGNYQKGYNQYQGHQGGGNNQQGGYNRSYQQSGNDRGRNDRSYQTNSDRGGYDTNSDRGGYSNYNRGGGGGGGGGGRRY